MIQDQLLEKIEIAYNNENCAGLEIALRTVVKLHEPYGDIMCVICEGTSYPCVTIQAIERELQ